MVQKAVLLSNFVAYSTTGRSAAASVMIISQVRMKQQQPQPKQQTNLPQLNTSLSAISLTPGTRSISLSGMSVVEAARKEVEATLPSFAQPQTPPQSSQPQSEGFVLDSGETVLTQTQKPIRAPKVVIKPKSMTRAKNWTIDVENLFRYQAAGYQSRIEYLGAGHEEPEIWPEFGFVKCLTSRETNCFMYFRSHRECEDRFLNKIKIYQY